MIGVVPWSKLPKLIGNSGKVFDIFTKAWNWGSEVARARELMGKINNAREAARTAARCAVSNSFVPGTKVLMADGSHKSIEDIRVGEQVLATDPITGESGPRTVVATIVGHGLKELVDITIDTDGQAGDAVGTITATSGHPIWTVNKASWVDAGSIKIGDDAKALDGAVLGVQVTRSYTRAQFVYNLTIRDIHTYYVAASTTPVLVHNAGGCPHVNYGAVPEGIRSNAESVIRQMDLDGTLPSGVRQGGGRAGPGIYSGGGLPPAPERYYVETDILPTPAGGTRPSSGRLIFGGKGEVYYTEHYDEFVQIRGPLCGC